MHAIDLRDGPAKLLALPCGVEEEELTIKTVGGLALTARHREHDTGQYILPQLQPRIGPCKVVSATTA